MRKLAILTLLLFAAPPAVQAQQSFSPGFDNQTGHAQNAARLSGLHNPASQVHQMDTNAANSYSPQESGRLTTATSPEAAATAPATQGGALPLNPAASGNMGAPGTAGGTGGAPQ